MLIRITGLFWLLTGIIGAGMSTLWMLLGDRLFTAMPSTLVMLASLVSSLLWGKAVLPPPYGAQMMLLLGGVLIVLGIRLIIGVPGTRLVATLLHMTGAVILISVAYLVMTTPISLDPRLRFGTVTSLGIATLSLLSTTPALYRQYLDRSAQNWKPGVQCPLCGRTIAAPGQCPTHDRPIPYPRLVDEVLQKVYPIPHSRPAVVGRGSNADIWLDEAADERYRRISRQHIRIEYSPQQQEYRVTALPDTGGVSIAAQPLGVGQTRVLTPDSEIMLADVRFVFQIRSLLQIEVDERPEDVRYALD